MTLRNPMCFAVPMNARVVLLSGLIFGAVLVALVGQTTFAGAAESRAVVTTHARMCPDGGCWLGDKCDWKDRLCRDYVRSIVYRKHANVKKIACKASGAFITFVPLPSTRLVKLFVKGTGVWQLLKC